MARFHSIAIALLTGSLTAQATWIVDPSGNGDFTSIASAQAAASPGDTLILVGTMPGVTLTNRLNIIAHGATLTSAFDIDVVGDVSVSGGDFEFGIGVGSSAVSLDGVTASLTVASGGTVSARECSFDTGAALLFPAVTVSANAHAVFDACTFQGTNAEIAGWLYPLAGSAGIRVDGRAELRDCTVNGGASIPHPWLGSIPGAPAIDLGSPVAHVDLKDCALASGTPFGLLHGSGSVRADNTPTGSPAATISVVQADLPWMTGSSAAPGGTLSIHVDSTAATLATISASLGMRSPIPTPIGNVWLAPAYVPVTAGLTDAEGEISTTVAVPSTIVRGLTVTFQGVVFPASGGIRATTPAVLHVF